MGVDHGYRPEAAVPADQLIPARGRLEREIGSAVPALYSQELWITSEWLHSSDAHTGSISSTYVPGGFRRGFGLDAVEKKSPSHPTLPKPSYASGRPRENFPRSTGSSSILLLEEFLPEVDSGPVKIDGLRHLHQIPEIRRFYKIGIGMQPVRLL